MLDERDALRGLLKDGQADYLKWVDCKNVFTMLGLDRDG